MPGRIISTTRRPDDLDDHRRVSGDRTDHRSLQPPFLPRHQRGLLRRGPHARAVHPPGVALRCQHDRLRRAGLRGRVLHGGDRRLLAHGLVFGPGHSGGLLLYRHPDLGARQAARLSHPGAVLPGEVGFERARAADLRRAGRAAHPLPSDRCDGRRLDAHPGDGRAGARLGGRIGDLRGGARLCDLRRHARHDLGERVPDDGPPDARLHRLLGDHRQTRRAHGRHDAARRGAAGHAGARRAHQAAEAPHLYLHPAFGGHVPPHVHPLADRQERLFLQADDRFLSDLHRDRLGAERVAGSARPSQLPGPWGGGRELGPGQDDRSARAGRAGGSARGRRLRRDHEFIRLAGALAGHHVHAGHRAPLRLSRPDERKQADPGGTAVHGGHPDRHLPAVAGDGSQHLQARRLVFHRLRRALSYRGGRGLLEAQHEVGGLRLHGLGGCALVVLRYHWLEVRGLHDRGLGHDAGGSHAPGFRRGHDPGLSPDPAAEGGDPGDVLPMRIAYIAAGAADMYCGSCLHDNTLASALQKMGHDVALIPTYTPLRTEQPGISLDRVFFGALNVYLQQKAAAFRHTPEALDRLLDRPGLIQRAARLGASTDPTELGDLTHSILQGEEGFQAKELTKLVDWLRDDFRPDVVHLTNSMFAGFARNLKRELGVPVVCSLQGEDLFLDQLREPWRARVRGVLSERARDVDAFQVNSAWYADFMAEYLGGIDRQRMFVVPLGLTLKGHGGEPRAEPQAESDRLTVGYLARICPEKGLHLLVEAFRLLTERLPGQIHLRVAGYLGERDRRYLEDLEARIAGWGLSGFYERVGEVDRDEKIRFLQSLDVLSVPTAYREPKGLFVLEALANGVPVVQPRHGAFPELIEATGGGLLVEPGSTEDLARGIETLLRDPGLRRELGQRGREAVRDRFDDRAEAEATLRVYERLLAEPARRATA